MITSTRVQTLHGLSLAYLTGFAHAPHQRPPPRFPWPRRRRGPAVTGIEEHAAELAALWPALAAALERDTAASSAASPGWTGATPFNLDVLAAGVILARDVPATARGACAALGEPWQPRPVLVCLRAFPRHAARMRHLGLLAAEQALAGAVRDWLRLVKRALGLREPDLPLPGRFRCPHADTCPEDHAEGSMLLTAGREGFLRPGAGGPVVEWVTPGRIYCPSVPCGASWPQGQWRLLGRMLGADVA